MAQNLHGGSPSDRPPRPAMGPTQMPRPAVIDNAPAKGAEGIMTPIPLDDDASDKAEVLEREAQIRKRAREHGGGPIGPTPAMPKGKGVNGKKPDLRAVFGQMLAGVGKGGKMPKKWLLGGAGLLLLVAAAVAFFVFGLPLIGDTGPVFKPAPEFPPVVEQPLPPPTSLPVMSDQLYVFRVPSNRTEWSLGWILAWIVLAGLMFFFRAETVRRGELWDFTNVVKMLVLAGLAMVLAKGLVVSTVDGCGYWLVEKCPLGSLSLELINNGSMIVYLLAAVTVSFGGLIASLTGARDFTPWGVATFGVSLMAKLLLPAPFIQDLAAAGMLFGLVIFIAEIAGAAKGQLALGGLAAVVVGLVLLAVTTPLLAVAFKQLAIVNMNELAWLAQPLYQYRFLVGLVIGWIVALAAAYFLTPSLAPQLQRLGTGSIVVGDAEKVDAAIVILMVVAIVVAFDWLPLVAGLV